MEIKDILELERRNNEVMLKAKLEKARHETQQETLNLGIAIISEQMRMSTMMLFYGAINSE